MRRFLQEVALRAGLEAAPEEAALAESGEDEDGRVRNRSLRSFVASSPSMPGIRTSMITTSGLRRSAREIALSPSRPRRSRECAASGRGRDGVPL